VDLFDRHLRDPNTWSAKTYLQEWLSLSRAIAARVPAAKFGMPDVERKVSWLTEIAELTTRKRKSLTRKSILSIGVLGLLVVISMFFSLGCSGNTKEQTTCISAHLDGHGHVRLIKPFRPRNHHRHLTSGRGCSPSHPCPLF
jgi:hypothetical protein